mgnify:CR=1 FL=1
MTSDLNIAWTKGHYKLVNWMPSQFLILFASAWSLTENYPLALITCAIYCECRASPLACLLLLTPGAGALDGAKVINSEPFDP